MRIFVRANRALQAGAVVRLSGSAADVWLKLVTDCLASTSLEIKSELAKLASARPTRRLAPTRISALSGEK